MNSSQPITSLFLSNSPSTDDFAYNGRGEVTGSTNHVETAAKWTKRGSAKMVRAKRAPEGLSIRVPTGRIRNNPTFDYDKIGNRESSTGYFASSYTANELNQ